MILLFNCTWEPEGPTEIKDSSSGCYTNIHLFMRLLNFSHVYPSGQWFKVSEIRSFVSCAFWPFKNLNKYSYGLILSQYLKTFLPWGCTSAKAKRIHCPKTCWYSYAIRDSKWNSQKWLRGSNEALSARIIYRSDHRIIFLFSIKTNFMRIMRHLCAYLCWALSSYAEVKLQKKKKKRLDQEFIQALRRGLVFQQWGRGNRCTDRSLWRAWKVKKCGSLMIQEGKGIVKATGQKNVLFW